MKNVILIGFVILLIGCGGNTGEERTREVSRRYCSSLHQLAVDTAHEVCMGNTVIKENESKQTVSYRCEREAKVQVCPVITMIITERCTNCYWSEVSAYPKQ